MADRLALVIATDSFQDAAVPQAAYAESDARAVAQALGGPLLLLGGQATRTAVASRLRKLARTPPAELVVYFSGHAVREANELYLVCQDTQTDDLAETGLPLQLLLDALAACPRCTVFLDVRSSLDTAVTWPEFHHPCFVSCDDGEKSHVSGSLKAGIWSHHLIEALTGRAPRAIDAGHLLTAASLQAHLAEELPRTLRSTFREAPHQTPRRFGPDRVVADLTDVLAHANPTADPRLQPLKRGALRSETRSKVKALAGFRKFHHLPDRVTASARKFVADASGDDVKQDIDATYTAVREALGYKRRDVEGSADRNTGFVRTPDFEYALSIDLDDDDPTVVVWRREVAGIRDPQVILGRPFQQVFGAIFDTLVFEFTKPFDLEAWVDGMEEAMPAGVKLRTASDCSSCDVHVARFAGVIRLYRDRVEIQGQKTPGSKGLVEAFLAFQDLWAGRRDLQELPLLEASATGGK